MDRVLGFSQCTASCAGEGREASAQGHPARWCVGGVLGSQAWRSDPEPTPCGSVLGPSARAPQHVLFGPVRTQTRGSALDRSLWAGAGAPEQQGVTT